MRPQQAGEPQPPAPAGPERRKQRVLFVCIGNSCRSQMAEALARTYGSDVMEVHSAGVSPATIISPLTRKVLGEKRLNIDGQFPKGVDQFARVRFDLIVNMSGMPVAMEGARILEWSIPDPIGRTEDVYRTVESQIEALVMRLILELRASTI
ncbi:MAG TPA: arsenate reductase ArsC [Bryobacteraceae bacterium]|nr:arsenate reductase ArsC [Bryobacteraceae bacterium]